MNENNEEISELEEKLGEKILSDRKHEIENMEKIRKFSFLKSRAAFFVKIFLTLIFLSYTVYRFPSFLQALKPPRPLRLGSYSADSNTDKCISALWKAAAGEKNLKCPVSNREYIVRENGDICCPDAQSHGLKSLCYENSVKSVAARDYDEK